MNIITNHKLYERRSKIGSGALAVAFVLLILGIVFVFQDGMLFFSYGAMIIAFIALQIGVFMSNRWSSKFQPHVQLEAALKGLDKQYTLYNYMTGAPHLLVGPAGIFHLITYHQSGTITYDENKKRWKQKGGNAYMKIFGQESLGRPDLDIQAYTTDLNKYFAKTVPELHAEIKHEPILLFLSEKVAVDAKNAPVVTITPSKLKDFIRKRAKTKPVDMEIIQQIVEQLPQESIVKHKK